MAKGTVDWNATETWQRVVAAIFATGVKIDTKQVALCFGTTYDTIESRFRKIKKDALALQSEVANGERAELPGRTSTKSTPSSTPRKRNSPKTAALGTVASGRVSKSTGKATKKSSSKQEMIEEDCAALGGFDEVPSFGGDVLGNGSDEDLI